ncbi:MAG: hypothetical protein IPK19_39860 [Chloroflexi bacterium]|nr:hypothetical protein [Chloroflexota bacterium]
MVSVGSAGWRTGRRVVNLRDRRVEVYTQPQRDTKPPYYAALQIYGPDIPLPLTLDGTEIATNPAGDLLP